MNYRDVIQKLIYVAINPLVKAMAAVGMTPNMVTALGLAGNIAATALFLLAALQLEQREDTAVAFALTAWGGGVILAAGLFDMMDGRLARTNGKSSTFGALWDSSLDRYSELVTLFGISVVFLKADWFWMGITTFMALTGSVMVSYVRARAEGLGLECKVGVMQRPERVVVTAVAAIVAGLTRELWWLAAGMIAIALLANLTAFWRIGYCYKMLEKRDRESGSVAKPKEENSK